MNRCVRGLVVAVEGNDPAMTVMLERAVGTAFQHRARRTDAAARAAADGAAAARAAPPPGAGDKSVADAAAARALGCPTRCTHID